MTSGAGALRSGAAGPLSRDTLSPTFNGVIAAVGSAAFPVHQHGGIRPAPDTWNRGGPLRELPLAPWRALLAVSVTFRAPTTPRHLGPLSLGQTITNRVMEVC